MTVKNAASALGEAIGKLIEDELERLIYPICSKRGYVYDRGGERPARRRGIKLSMVNKSGNRYQLDGVIETTKGEPIVLVESKYLRYKKHNRDKGSWTCAAHYSLRKSHPTIRKSIAVLSGNWSAPSKAFIRSFGIELYEVPFEEMCQVLRKYNVVFDWDEKDNQTPKRSLQRFNKLSSKQRDLIAQELLQRIQYSLTRSIEETLLSGEDWAKRVREIEVMLKTDRNEYFTYTFRSIKDVLKFLVELQVDLPDLRGKLV
ncbi:MAG: hypothetical protein FJ217_10790 [Ignavibacteria bacterium]|nr:hypothetical protein [Ignavibacteria bacterium]